MSVSRVTSYVEQIQRINAQIRALMDKQTDLEENTDSTKEQVRHTIVEISYNSIDIHPRHQH